MKASHNESGKSNAPQDSLRLDSINQLGEDKNSGTSDTVMPQVQCLVKGVKYCLILMQWVQECDVMAIYCPQSNYAHKTAYSCCGEVPSESLSRLAL